MQYKASLGTTARIITTGATLLFIIIALFGIRGIAFSAGSGMEKTQGIFIALFLGAIYLIVYMYRTLSYYVDRDNITIHRPAKDVQIPIQEIAEVFQATSESMRWSVRTFGNGGLFGFYGKFWNKIYGNMTWYATRRDNFIVVVTKDNKKIVLTPDQLSMLHEIQRRLKPRNGEYDN